MNLKKANDYVDGNKDKINPKFRPNYHLVPPIGWLNDPNGMIFFNDEYHVFFQFNPYKPKWDTMHWGHYTSKDMINWEWKGVALAPDEDYDNGLGVFSGTAIEHDGQLKLFYTGVSFVDGKEHQQQCLAVSTDGINLEKYKGNPIIKTSDYINGFDTCARDPKVFVRNNKFFMLVGTKNISNSDYPKGGQILLFESENTLDWFILGAIMQQETITEQGFLECPDLVEIDGFDVLFCSPQHLNQRDLSFQNPHSNVYFLGKLDLDRAKYSYSKFDDIDSGFNFYACQTLKAVDGRNIVMAWMNLNMPEYPTFNDGWAGTMSLPRELSIKEGRLYQQPICELRNYRKARVEYNNILIKSGECIRLDGVNGNSIELNIEADVSSCKSFVLKVFAGCVNETVFSFAKDSSIMTLDRTKSGISLLASEDKNPNVRSVKVDVENGILKLQLFLDVCIAEMFLQDGQRTMTANIFPDSKDTDIKFEAEGGEVKILKLEKYDLTV